MLSAIAGLLALGVLVATNLYLARRFRRMLSAALAAAALVTLSIAATGSA